MNSASTGSSAELVDRMMELYCQWREECVRVQAAYEHFSSAATSDRELAFAVYTAALDREGSASDAYAEQIRLITARVPRGTHETVRLR
jgi:hypothetical protein